MPLKFNHIGFTALSVFLLSSCTLPSYFSWGKEVPISIDTPPSISEGTDTISIPADPVIQSGTSAENNLDDALKDSEKQERASILTKRAVYLANNNEYSEAAQLYERVLRLNKTDEIERKLAHISFRAKNFQRSSDLYKKFSESLYQSEKEEFLHALRYTGDDDFTKRIESIDIPENIREAFKVSWKCEHEFISCEDAIRGYKYSYGPILDLQNALKNYESLGNKDPSYKEALLVGTFYKNRDYTTAMRIGENILRRKPDYRPILKIVGFSAFMVKQYERAQGVLSKYKKLEPKDAEADFILGLIQFEKQDYETSNIYFNKAVLGGYKPKTVVERKLAYNYFVLDLPKNMFQVLGYLVMEPDATEADITNAIYLALDYGETRNAGEWIRIGKEKFPSSDNIQALEIWYLRITGKTNEAQTIVDEILARSDNLIALVQGGILAQESGFTEKAKTLLKRAKIIDAGGTWSETITEHLSKNN